MGEKKKAKEKGTDIPLDELAEKIDESQFESTFFNTEEDSNYSHFSSVIKEIKDGAKNSHLVKIRPPLFLLSGFLSNISRKISGMDNLKILDNDRWKSREVKHLQDLHPQLISSETDHDNAFVVEKIDGDVAYEILCSDEVDNEKKIDTITKIAGSLKDIHDQDLYHGEPTTQNCILGDDGDIYWIDFEIEYHQDLRKAEEKARDLEQLTLSILGAFEEEGDVGIDDHKLTELIFESYGDEEVVSNFVNNPHLPLIGPHRVYQFSFVSVKRFYQVQINLLDHLRNYQS